MSTHPLCVLHIPHSSQEIPPDLRHTLLLDDDALEQELLRMTDRYTDLLFAQAPDDACTVIYPVSRLIVDPERFVLDSEEPMVARGMGVIYTRTSDGQPLRHPPLSAQRAALLERFYKPHHLAVTTAVLAALSEHDSALVIDCHSFPARPLPYELDQTSDRRDICIGTDSFHTPLWLSRAASRLFEQRGFTVAINRPFDGALVPGAFYQRDPRVHALMIELNRSRYMCEDSGEQSNQFEDVMESVHQSCRELMALSKRQHR